MHSVVIEKAYEYLECVVFLFGGKQLKADNFHLDPTHFH